MMRLTRASIVLLFLASAILAQAQEYVKLRWEALNAFNHPQFIQVPKMEVSSTPAGQFLNRDFTDSGIRSMWLTHADVDCDAGTLLIRHTKFDKSRVVPIAPDLARRLSDCRTLTILHFGACLPDTPFFSSPRGGQYSITALREAFHQTLATAGIARTSGKRNIRLHDLRHSFAVTRLLLWCEQNVDLDAKLPLLATYLGHIGLASSQRYLQLTQDLMAEITRRHQARFGYLIDDGGR
jgi:site-specific recombinase XerC